MRRIALFGGSFDPIHIGHTHVAKEALQQLQADRVIFIPAKRSPLKQSSPMASDLHRLNMIHGAIQDVENFEVNDCEFKRAAPSYTLDTIIYLRSTLPKDTELFWLIGADTLHDLPYWYHIDELMEQCHLAILTRGGYKFPNFSQFETLWGLKRAQTLQNHVIKTRMIELSSSEIRTRLRLQQDVSACLHPAVLQYIQQHRLYQDE